MKSTRHKLTLHGPAVYEITVPGELDETWTDWDGKMTVTLEREGDGPPVTVLTGIVDQAALHSLLCRIYSLGLPLIPVTCVECRQDGRSAGFLTIRADPFIAPCCLHALPVHYGRAELQQDSASAVGLQFSCDCSGRGPSQQWPRPSGGRKRYTTKRGLTLVSAIRVISCILKRGDDSDAHPDLDAWLESLASASRRACIATGTRATHRHLSSAQVHILKAEARLFAYA